MTLRVNGMINFRMGINGLQPTQADECSSIIRAAFISEQERGPSTRPKQSCQRRRSSGLRASLASDISFIRRPSSQPWCARSPTQAQRPRGWFAGQALATMPSSPTGRSEKQSGRPTPHLASTKITRRIVWVTVCRPHAVTEPRDAEALCKSTSRRERAVRPRSRRDACTLDSSVLDQGRPRIQHSRCLVARTRTRAQTVRKIPSLRRGRSGCFCTQTGSRSDRVILKDARSASHKKKNRAS